MTPLHVELPCSPEVESLVHFLSDHGLAASLAGRDDLEIEVQYAVDPDVRVRQDFESTLALWLATLEEPLVPAVGRERDTSCGRRETEERGPKTRADGL